MIQVKEIYWLAGLLEGEGYFGFHRSTTDGYVYGKPRITLKMTDKDTIEKAHKLLRCSGRITVSVDRTNFISRKSSYVIYVNGKDAIAWMFILYSLMGKRRQEKIREVINEWKSFSVGYKGIRSAEQLNTSSICS